MKELIGEFFNKNPTQATIITTVVVGGGFLLAYGLFGKKGKLLFTKEGVEASHKKNVQNSTNTRSKNKGGIYIEQKNEGDNDENEQTATTTNSDGEVKITQTNRRNPSLDAPTKNAPTVVIDKKTLAPS